MAQSESRAPVLSEVFEGPRDEGHRRHPLQKGDQRGVEVRGRASYSPAFKSSNASRRPNRALVMQQWTEDLQRLIIASAVRGELLVRTPGAFQAEMFGATDGSPSTR